MEFTSSAILDTLYSLIFHEDEGEAPLSPKRSEEDSVQNSSNEPNKRSRTTRSPSTSNLIEKGANHVFQESKFAIPTFCNYCKEYIWGFTSLGHNCTVCGYTTHAKCTPRDRERRDPHLRPI
eukprot:TRINITY_DN4408_c0_g1_i9.p1 TRINITY_DN4408_c0_g1~~TRINITY_DN4408_c0_g1_i9.p1  ORF type:complete len:133 (+),score=20.11 TRINITY_DN4408_c0_g1_i9:36-401(+)